MKGLDDIMMRNRLPLLGLVMIAVGAVKTWLHMGTVPLLALPTCTGDVITVELAGGSWLARAHCWGCYMLVAGLAVTVFALLHERQKRRSVAV